MPQIHERRDMPDPDSNDDWRQRAACRGTNPDLFFPVGTTGPAIEQIESAKTVCRQCDSQQDCLEFAISTNPDSGIWGGATEEERRRLRKQFIGGVSLETLTDIA